MRIIDTLTERECVVRPTWREWVVTDRVGEGGGTKFTGYKAKHEEYLISNRQLSLQLTRQTVGYCFNKQFSSNVYNRKCTDKEQSILPMDRNFSEGNILRIWLVAEVPATCKCISGTDLLRQLYLLSH